MAFKVSKPQSKDLKTHEFMLSKQLSSQYTTSLQSEIQSAMKGEQKVSEISACFAESGLILAFAQQLIKTTDKSELTYLPDLARFVDLNLDIVQGFLQVAQLVGTFETVHGKASPLNPSQTIIQFIVNAINKLISCLQKPQFNDEQIDEIIGHVETMQEQANVPVNTKASFIVQRVNGDNVTTTLEHLAADFVTSTDQDAFDYINSYLTFLWKQIPQKVKVGQFICNRPNINKLPECNQFMTDKLKFFTRYHPDKKSGILLSNLIDIWKSELSSKGAFDFAQANKVHNPEKAPLILTVERKILKLYFSIATYLYDVVQGRCQAHVQQAFKTTKFTPSAQGQPCQLAMRPGMTNRVTMLTTLSPNQIDYGGIFNLSCGFHSNDLTSNVPDIARKYADKQISDHMKKTR